MLSHVREAPGQRTTGHPKTRGLRKSTISAAVLCGMVTMLLGVGAASATTPTSVTFAPGSTGANATSTWTVGFTSSASGALIAPNTISVTFDSGFVLPTAPAVTFATGFSGTCAGTTTATTSGQVVTITLSGTCALAASIAATVTVAGITNAAAGTYANTTFAVATTQDTATSPTANVVIVAAPTNVVTAPASSVTATSATLNGTVNPDGVATTYYFEYGTTLAYGTTTSVTAAGSGITAVLVSANLTALSANVTYDVQLVATNANGTTYGGNVTVVATATATTTRLILRKSSDPFGRETRQRLSVTVSAISGGATPTGQVALKAGNATLCTITLSSGAGTCTLSARTLSVKTYRIYAVYAGAGPYGSSVSDKHLYRVTRS